MDIKILTQPKLCNGKDFSLGEYINSLLLSKRPKYTDISLHFGVIKDNAYKKLSDSLKNFILNGGNASFYLSQDKKNSAKNVINSLLELGVDVYLFNGNDKDFVSDFQYKSVIVKSSKKAIVLLSSGNFTLSGLFDGYNIVTEITYDLPEDIEEFEKFTSSIICTDENNLFLKLTRDKLDEVLNVEKEIPSIEEFTHKDIDNSEPIVTIIDDIDVEIDQNVDFLIPSDVPPKPKKEKTEVAEDNKKIIYEPIVEIVSDEPKYYMEDNEALDIENMLFTDSLMSKPTKKLTTSEPENINEPESVDTQTEKKIITKTTNLSKTSIFMLELPKITKKGASAGEIKIPVYLRDLIPAFWGWPKEYSLDKSSAEKLKKCTFKIVDTNNAGTTITDEDVKLFQRESENSFVILSKELTNLDLQENDIMRLIKTQSKNDYYFTCEIIRKNANEYPIWEQFCTNLLKGSKRKYGMM